MPEREMPPLTPEEIRRYCGGGKRCAEVWIAQRAVDGDLFPRKVIGVDSEGNPIYAPKQQELSPSHTFLGPQGKKRRQPPRARK